MIVPDASVTVFLFMDTHDDPRVPRAVTALRADVEWIVPEHWRVETVNAVRGLFLGGQLDEIRASRAVKSLMRARAVKVETVDLIPRIWAFRSSMTAYDAAYVALAQAQRLTLVTADGRLARAAGGHCDVTLIT